MITRREVLATLPALSAASFVSAQAPSRSGAKRLAELSLEAGPERADASQPLDNERYFWDALSRKGWRLGDNIVIERAYANWKTERLFGLAAELVRKRVDVILCDYEAAMVAAARATQSIPILFRDAFMPVEQGLVESLSRPGRNLTGTAMHAGTDVATKRLEFLRAIVRGERLSWLWGADSRSAETVAGAHFDLANVYETAAAGLGFKTRLHLVPAPSDIDRVLDEVVASKAQAMTAGGWPVFAVRNRVAEFALRAGLPLATNHRSYVEVGGLLSYGPSGSERKLMGERFIEYLDRVLRGAKPSELPVIQPSRYELVINMKTAKLLGLPIPQPVLQRADELLQ